LELGVVYGLRRDHDMRPVIVINIRRMLDTNISVDRLIDLSNFLFEYTIENAMIPGKIENWDVILDLKDVGFSEIPRDRIQPLVTTMSTNFRGRLYRLYATDVSFILRSLWNLVRAFVDEFTNNKLSVHGSIYDDEICNLIAEDNLETKYGGKLANMESDFFPP